MVSAFDLPLKTQVLLYGGFLLAGFSSATWYYCYSRVRSIGVRIGLKREVWPAYRRERNKHGWPAWPLYVFWPLFIAGWALILLGAIRL